jgi:hypothetical protein
MAMAQPPLKRWTNTYDYRLLCVLSLLLNHHLVFRWTIGMLPPQVELLRRIPFTPFQNTIYQALAIAIPPRVGSGGGTRP